MVDEFSPCITGLSPYLRISVSFLFQRSVAKVNKVLENFPYYYDVSSKCSHYVKHIDWILISQSQDLSSLRALNGWFVCPTYVQCIYLNKSTWYENLRYVNCPNMWRWSDKCWCPHGLNMDVMHFFGLFIFHLCFCSYLAMQACSWVLLVLVTEGLVWLDPSGIILCI